MLLAAGWRSFRSDPINGTNARTLSCAASIGSVPRRVAQLQPIVLLEPRKVGAGVIALTLSLLDKV
jgi:hypothetical protein